MERMRDLPDWKGQPYYPISQYYQKRFGEKVYKISVSTAESCPVRVKKDICVFCDEWGSAGSLLIENESLSTKIRLTRERIAKRYRANRFLVYFQPYTSTFAKIAALEKQLEISLAEDKVVGVVLGTRPDCIPKKLLPVLRKYHEQAYISVELGVQSFDDQQLKFLKRGHNAAQSVTAIQQLYEFAGVDIGVHLIFGLPNESLSQISECADRVSNLPVTDVKLHNLHVLVNTPLEKLYRQGHFVPDELGEYTEKVIHFLSYLKPDIPVQRLAAVASRWDELVAPEWTKGKMRPAQFIINEMKKRGKFQGFHISNKLIE